LIVKSQQHEEDSQDSPNVLLWSFGWRSNRDYVLLEGGHDVDGRVDTFS